MAIELNAEEPTVSVYAEYPDNLELAEALIHDQTGPSDIITVPSPLVLNGDHLGTGLSFADHSLKDSTVLFLSDLLPPFKDDVLKSLTLAHLKLTGLGVNTISPLTESEDDLDEDEISALAEVSKTRGQRQLNSTSTNKAMTAWLTKHDDIDAIAWLGSDSKLYVFTENRRSIGPISEAPSMLTEALLSIRGN